MFIEQKIIPAQKIIGLTALWYLTIFFFQNAVTYIFPPKELNTIYESSQKAFLFESIIMFAATMLLLLVIGKLICKIPMKLFGLTFTAHWFRDWGIGAAIGVVSILSIWFVIVFFNGYYVQFNGINKDTCSSLAYLLVGMLFVGYYEEALTRGAMAYIGRKGGRIFCSIFIGLIFSFMHIFNTGFNLLSAANILLIAVLSSQLTWIFNDLWVAIGFHTAWNFITVFLGVPVSGIQFISIFSSDYSSGNLINGSAFGIESSLVGFIYLILFVIFMGFFLKSRNQNNDNPSDMRISKNIRIYISISLIFILLTGSSLFKIVHQTAIVDDFVKEYYQVIDTYNMKDNISGSDFFAQESSLAPLYNF